MTDTISAFHLQSFTRDGKQVSREIVHHLLLILLVLLILLHFLFFPKKKKNIYVCVGSLRKGVIKKLVFLKGYIHHDK